MIVVESAGKSDVGKKRTGNEDSFFFDDGMGVYVVADGMGGHNAGEVASGLVVKIVEEQLRRFTEGKDADKIVAADQDLADEAKWLNACIHIANSFIHQQAQENEAQKGMGSTISAVMLTETSLIAANVGDSPIYLIRDGAVETISVPHTMMAEYEAIAPGGSKALSDKFKHMITRAMGIEATVKPDISERDCKQGDLIVICSDGLSDLVKPEEIMEAVSGQPAEKACNTLVNMANDRGGVDNITVIVLKIVDFAKEDSSSSIEPPPKSTADTGKGQEKTLEVSIDTDDASFSAVIHDIDPEGAFIETTHPFAIDSEIYLTVSDPDGSNPFMIIGRVVDRRSKGIDVAFDKLADKKREKILTLKKKILE